MYLMHSIPTCAHQTVAHVATRCRSGTTLKRAEVVVAEPVNGPSAEDGLSAALAKSLKDYRKFVQTDKEEEGSDESDEDWD
jgi:hypothetical protein